MSQTTLQVMERLASIHKEYYPTYECHIWNTCVDANTPVKFDTIVVEYIREKTTYKIKVPFTTQWDTTVIDMYVEKLAKESCCVL